MGFYFRKSLKVGPLRFNLSKSGIGVSTGIKGFRVGTGPRGNYVHMGRGGLYYRQTLPAGSQSQRTPDAGGRTDVLNEIGSSNVAGMTDSSAHSLLNELNEKRRKLPFWPIVAAIGLLVLYVIRAEEAIVVAAVVAAGVVGLWFVYQRDQLRLTTVLFYNLDGPTEQAFQKLHDAFTDLAKAGRVAHIPAKGATSDWKRNAGASTLVRRNTIRPVPTSPPRVQTNIIVPAIPVGKQTLYFFPERILVFEPNGVGAVGYRDLTVNVEQSRFIENEAVPPDAQVVGRTWKYVNKKGGPDRRYKDNRELPIALYEEIHLASGSGLNEVIQVSKVGLGASFRTALMGLPQPAAPVQEV